MLPLARRQLVVAQRATTIGEDGGRLVKHARYYWLLLVEGYLTRRLLGEVVPGMAALSVLAR